MCHTAGIYGLNRHRPSATGHTDVTGDYGEGYGDVAHRAHNYGQHG